MKHIYRTSSTGEYSVADIYWQAEAMDSSFYGEERKSLRAAINDGKRYAKSHPDAWISIYAKAELNDYNADGTLVPKFCSNTDSVRVGEISADGKYEETYETEIWLP